MEKISRNELVYCTGGGALLNTILVSMINFLVTVTFFGKKGRR